MHIKNYDFGLGRSLGLLVFLFFLSNSCSFAGELVPLLTFPQKTVHAGQNIIVTVYFHNEGKELLAAAMPHQLQLLIDTEHADPIELSAFETIEGREISLAPGSFHKKQYSLSIPVDLDGTVHYALGGFPGSDGLLLIKSPQQIPTTDQPQVAEETDEYPTLKNLETLYQSYAANLSTYKPIYFLVGTDPEKSKFQISFKYRLFNPSGSLSQMYGWFSGFHVAYTQTSFWDLDSDSAPFEDTSYKPEIFFLGSNIKLKPSWMDGFFIQTGLQHESNGRGGDFSRSTNYAYLKPIFLFYDQSSQLGLAISPKLMSYFHNDDDLNPDLDDYRGFFELETSVGKAHSYMLRTRLQFAEEGPSIQADLTYPIHRLLADNLDLYFQIQYSNSLAESLINYRDRVEAVRIGFALVR